MPPKINLMLLAAIDAFNGNDRMWGVSGSDIKAAIVSRNSEQLTLIHLRRV
jgi:hypothetical protein